MNLVVSIRDELQVEVPAKLLAVLEGTAGGQSTTGRDRGDDAAADAAGLPPPRPGHGHRPAMGPRGHGTPVKSMHNQMKRQMQQQRRQMRKPDARICGRNGPLRSSLPLQV